MARAVRQSLMMLQGDLTIPVARPLSAVMLAAAALILMSPLVGAAKADAGRF